MLLTIKMQTVQAADHQLDNENMKLNKIVGIVLLTGCLDMVASLSARATLIAAWDFPASTTSTAAPNTPAIFAATVGAGSLDVSAFAATIPNPERTMFGGTTLNAFSGGDAGSTAALALANSSANGESIVFSLNMSLYENLMLSFATRGTSTGFNSHQWSFSTDGNIYTDFGVNTAVTATSFVVKTVDFSSVTALDGDDSVFIKLTVNGASGVSGNNRLDNIQFNADRAVIAAVPEPSTFIAGALLALPFGARGIRCFRDRKRA